MVEVSMNMFDSMCFLGVIVEYGRCLGAAILFNTLEIDRVLEVYVFRFAP